MSQFANHDSGTNWRGSARDLVVALLQLELAARASRVRQLRHLGEAERSDIVDRTHDRIRTQVLEHRLTRAGTRPRIATAAVQPIADFSSRFLRGGFGQRSARADRRRQLHLAYSALTARSGVVFDAITRTEDSDVAVSSLRSILQDSGAPDVASALPTLLRTLREVVLGNDVSLALWKAIRNAANDYHRQARRDPQVQSSGDDWVDPADDDADDTIEAEVTPQEIQAALEWLITQGGKNDVAAVRILTWHWELGQFGEEQLERETARRMREVSPRSLYLSAFPEESTAVPRKTLQNRIDKLVSRARTRVKACLLARRNGRAAIDRLARYLGGQTARSTTWIEEIDRIHQAALFGDAGAAQVLERLEEGLPATDSRGRVQRVTTVDLGISRWEVRFMQLGIVVTSAAADEARWASAVRYALQLAEAIAGRCESASREEAEQVRASLRPHALLALDVLDRIAPWRFRPDELERQRACVVKLSLVIPGAPASDCRELANDRLLLVAPNPEGNNVLGPVAATLRTTLRRVGSERSPVQDDLPVALSEAVNDRLAVGVLLAYATMESLRVVSVLTWRAWEQSVLAFPGVPIEWSGSRSAAALRRHGAVLLEKLALSSADQGA